MIRTMLSRSVATTRHIIGFITVCAMALAMAPGAGVASARNLEQAAETVYALTDRNELFTFTSTRPDRVSSRKAITGLQPGEKLLGIDFRPANGQLYGLGSTSRLYLIAPRSGVALPIGPGPFSTLLNGTSFGFDFNPAVDRIRIVSDTGQNLRVHPDTGLLVMADGGLAYAASDTNSGKQPGVNGAAYTNPDNDATTATTLYVLDAAQDVLAIQNPPNDGVLNTVGALGMDIEDLVGFDITAAGMAYGGLLARDGVSGAVFATINLQTGQLNRVGRIGNGRRVLGLSIPTVVKPIAGQMVYALNASNELLQFDSASPGTITSRTSVTGLQPDEKLLGIDFRSANGQLYGLGSTSRLYLIDATSGVATALGAGPFTPALSGNSFGFDFNPTVDRIRIVSDTGQNLRANPDTGALVMADGGLAYAASDPNKGKQPGINAAGYTNPDNDVATGTTLYVIDAARDVLAIQNPPNDGVLNTVGALGMDAEALVGVDITAAGVAYGGLLARDGISGAVFVTINLGTGQITTIGRIGTGEQLLGLAVAVPAPTPAP